MVDWNVCDMFASKTNIRKAVCDYWNNKDENETVLDLEKVFQINRTTLVNYLNTGNKFNWCNYDGDLEKRKSRARNIRKISKEIAVYKDDILVGKFSSITELFNSSKEMFGVKRSYSSIYIACKSSGTYKGFTLKLT